MADAIGYKISTRAKATSGSRMIPLLAALMRATRSLSAIRVIDLVVDEIEGQATRAMKITWRWRIGWRRRRKKMRGLRPGWSMEGRAG